MTGLQGRAGRRGSCKKTHQTLLCLTSFLMHHALIDQLVE